MDDSFCYARRAIKASFALEPPIDRGSNAHCDERPEAGQRHVLVRVPLVALRVEIRLAEFAAEHY